jgi:hypothetical protein
MNTLKKMALLMIVTVLAVQWANAQYIYKGHIADNTTKQPLECACIRANSI